MRGRQPIHNPTSLGSRGGSESQVLTVSQLAPHNHDVEGGSPTSSTGGGQPISTMPPYASLRCIIATVGIYPSRSRRELGEEDKYQDQVQNYERRLAGSSPFIGTVAWVPYTFAPRGWADCDGSLISVSSNDALFSLLGTQ
jgi:microcystin-dependent protein